MKTIKTYEDFVNEEINLKKTLATGALAAGMAFSNPATSQITTTSIPKPITKEVIKSSYDSLSNYPDSITSLIGQELYLNSYSSYAGLYKNIEDLGKYIDEEFGKKQFEKKYYTLIDIFEDTTNERYQKSSTNYYVFKLGEKSTKSIYYMRYDDSHGNLDSKYFPFIVVGFFEKIKKKYLGSTLDVSRGSDNKINNSLIIQTSGLPPGTPGQLYSFVDGKKVDGIILFNNRDGYSYLPTSNDLKTGRFIKDLKGLYTCTGVSLDENGNIVIVYENNLNSFYIYAGSVESDASGLKAPYPGRK